MILFPKYVTSSARMRNILFVVVLWICAENACVVEAQSCSFDQATIYINDTNVGEEIANIVLPTTAQYESFYVQDTLSAVNTTIAENYFEFKKVNDTHLSFKTTADFKNLGSDADSNGAELIVMTLYVTLKCGDTSNESPVIVAIKCSFTNDPTFSTTTYSYPVPIPIMQKTDVTVYGIEITVTDTNFANTAMTFTIEPDDFEIAASKIDNKHFRAVFGARNILQFYGERTYTLTAEDSGKRKTSVEITMKPDAKSSLDSPSFKESYYYFDYDGETSMTPKNGDIVINSNKVNEATWLLEGENYADNFVIKLDNSSKTLLLLSDGIVSLDAGQIILTLSFTTDSTAKTTLLINIPTVIPKFSNKHYRGTFDANSKEIVWQEEINVEDAKSVAIIEKSSLFSIDQTTYKITSNGNLSKSDFDENLNIIFTVVATSATSNTSEAAVVISLKTETANALEFDSTYYTANYSKENSEWVVNLNTEIGFVDVLDFSDIEIQVDESYSSNFKVEHDSSKWKISVSSPLTKEVLNNNRKLAIPLTAASKTDLNARTVAVLILNLPDKIEINFGNSYYSGSYVQGTENDTIVLTKEIQLTGADDADVTFIVEEYEEYLQLEHDSGSFYNLTVKQNLNSSALDSKSPLLITIVAVTETSVAQAILVLELPDQSLQLKFEKPYYHATYTEDNIVLDDASINLIKTDALEVKFSCEGYDDNFELKNSTSDSYIIKVKSPLNDTSISQLTIVITAFNSDSEISASTVLIINIPQESQALRFAKPYYSAKYDVVDSKGVVTLSEEMQLVGADNLTVSFYVDEYHDYLKIDYISGSSYTISVLKNLNSTALNHESPLLIIIAASTETTVAYTTLVLELPDQSLQLKFEKPYYHATYTEDNIVLDDASINLIKTDALDVKFSCEGYDENFELKNSAGDSYTIRVKSPLNDTSISQLTIVITAFNSDSEISASTVLIINIPQESQALRFAKPYYSAKYDVVDSKGVVTLTEDMQLVGADNLKVSFYVDEYHDYLKINSISGSSYTISVLKNLNSTALNHESPLLIIIAASTETTVAYTTLVLGLPDQSLQLEFEKQFYYAKYSIDDTIILDDGGIKIIQTDGLEVELLCEGYENDLELIQDSATGSYTIAVKNPLNETVIYLNTQLNMLIKASASKLSASTVLVLYLPSLEVFSTNQFVAEYQLSSDGKNNDILFIEEAIKVTSNIFTQISFIGYENNFKASCSAIAECSITVENNLNSTVLNLNDELIINLAATNGDYSSTKTAVLLLKLPSKSFGKDIYSGAYSVDEGSISNVGDIKVDNIDASLVDVKLKDYSEYFSLNPSDNKWTIKVTNPLPSKITSKQETLTTSLVAVRTSDKKTLTISTLQILLPINVPKFEKFTYYGTYENSVDPEVKLEDKISLADDSLAASKIFIDSKEEYSEYFHLSDSKEEILITKPLGDDIVENVTSIALTLKAESESGTYGHATIVLSLPRKLRDSSVEVKNQQVLFTATYQAGSFKSPSITLSTNATTDDDILVEISNDLDLDSTLYFSYKYSNQVVTITTIAELPDDFLKNNKVLPLKLAIKDKNTKDTVYAVLNVDIGSSSDSDKEDSSTAVYTGLIVAVSILAVLLLLVILATFLFWFFKLRENHAVEISPEEAIAPTKPNTFAKNDARKQVIVSNALRRPTGIAIGLNPLSQDESLTDDDRSSIEPEAEKKVAFDEKVEKIDNEIDDDDDEEDNRNSGRMQSVTDRRPTKFVFNHPLELEELEDENGNLSESTEAANAKFSNGVKKKGVAFDQNVERIDIETEEGQESDTEK